VIQQTNLLSQKLDAAEARRAAGKREEEKAQQQKIQRLDAEASRQRINDDVSSAAATSAAEPAWDPRRPPL
jgi:hypothetical protein